MGRTVPLFLKIAPDLDEDQVRLIAATLKARYRRRDRHQHHLPRDAVSCPPRKAAVGGLSARRCARPEPRGSRAARRRWAGYPDHRRGRRDERRRALRAAEVGDDAVDHAHAGERQVHCGRIFGRCRRPSSWRRAPSARPRSDAGHQVHRAAHALDHLAGIIQLAGRPSLTCIAPRIDRLILPPRIIAKLSGCRRCSSRQVVTVCLPALMRSASTSVSVRERPMPSMPFSLCSQTDLRVDEVGHQGRQADAEVHVEAVGEFLGARGHLVGSRPWISFRAAQEAPRGLRVVICSLGRCASRCASRAWR